MCPSLALHITDIHRNSLGKTLSATSPAAFCSSPSLYQPPHGHSPLLAFAEIAACCLFSSSPQNADLLWSLGRRALGTEKQGAVTCPLHTGCGQGIQAAPLLMQSSHRGGWISMGELWRAEHLCGVRTVVMGLGWHQRAHGGWAGVLWLKKVLLRLTDLQVRFVTEHF